MKTQFDARDYGYTIVSRFESNLRDQCKYIIPDSKESIFEEIPKGIIDVAKKRNDNIESLDDILENIDFSHLKEIILFKDHFNKIINSKKLSKENFNSIMDSLYLLRCKIAHIRKYFTNADLNCLIEESKKIDQVLLNRNNDYVIFLDEIMKNPGNLAIKIPTDYFEDDFSSVINNLPVADYEYEGGFVGRNDDEEKIIKMMKDINHKVITIAGAGGVGKSALALKVVNDIIANGIIKYDFVVWVSAKENRLSYLGIEDMEPTLRDYDELLDTILGLMGFDSTKYNDIVEKERDVNGLFDACDKALLIIDNLETITDERIINFILDSHPNVNFLITSRRGLGQVERRYDLKELQEKDAIHLFRVICKEKGLYELAECNEKIISSYVNKVYCYPLAIKWVLGQAAIGKEIQIVINNINEQSSNISKFCFEQVFSELSNESKMIMYTLSTSTDAMPKGILKYISGLDDVCFEDCIRDLLLVSLVLPTQKINKENGEIHSFYSLLPLTRGFVTNQLDNNHNIKSIIQDRKISVQTTLEEAERAKVQYRYSLSNFGATTEEEKVASVLAQTAYQKYQAGNYLEAIESFRKAIQIAPGFASIYRNWAIVESSESHWEEADNLMEKASKLNPNDTQIWLVWGNIKRKNDKIKDAYDFYGKAYKLSPSDNVVLNSYGQAISRLGDYKRADMLFHEALQLVEGVPHNKHLIINYTFIAENLKRWAESLMNDVDYSEASKKLEAATDAIEKVLSIDKNDNKANKLFRDILYNNALNYSKMRNYDSASLILRRLLNLPCNGYRETEYHVRGVLLNVSNLCAQNNFYAAKKSLAQEEKNIKKIHKGSIFEKYKSIKEMLDKDDQFQFGTIVKYNVKKKFVIIEATAMPKITYIAFLNDFREYISDNDVLKDKNVKFISKNYNGKHHATNVEFCEKIFD